jgi:peptidoglycan-associated lipoprotein
MGGEGVGGGAFNPLDGGAGGAAGGFGPGGSGADGNWAGMDSPLGSAGGAGTNINAINEPWAQVVVYFAFDSATLGDSEMPKLEALAGHMREHADYIAVVEGHCDDRGSDEYNRALGENRALVVRDHLISLGIEQGRLETVSYGEERPAVPNATSESQHAQNRRAQFVVGTRK